jgi:inner membrane protein involved in colicin E2 resistance
MIKRLAAITFIFICTSVGWFVLAGSLFVRSDDYDHKMKESVGKLWGSSQIQTAPLVYEKIKIEAPRTTNNPDEKPRWEYYNKHYPLQGSNIDVSLKLSHRKKGLLWYSTYKVDFTSQYLVENRTKTAKEFYFDFGLPNAESVYDNFKLVIDGKEVGDVAIQNGRIIDSFDLEPGKSISVAVSYSSQGMDTWHYDFGQNANQIKNFSLAVNTNFVDIDFPDEGISPTNKFRTKDGWQLDWQYKSLLTGTKIGVIMPHKLNPGPWLGRVTTAAPVSLFLFFFLLYVITVIKENYIHPMNYFFIGTGFFSFHLLMAYLVDHISVNAAFIICSIVSLFLVISYMRLVIGIKNAIFQVGLSQLIYLVFFSYTFFFKGYTGLVITILCVCTLFIVMQATGKVNWEELFAKQNKRL